ncbi:MAG: hypothetical protein ACRDPO_25510 [Streptosporangiaceae bacterium]
MSDADQPDQTLTAALIQISGHAERIAALDSRYQQLADALRSVAAEAAAAAADGDRQAEVLASLDVLERQVSSLTTRLATLAASEDDDDGAVGYRPVPPPRWWKITGSQREDAVERLRAWVNQVYRPSYGQLAALLPPCWEQHPLCLNTLDWLSELWSELYLAAERTPEILAAQGEWQTRLLPSAADQMALEADGCKHALTNRELPLRTRPTAP